MFFLFLFVLFYLFFFVLHKKRAQFKFFSKKKKKIIFYIIFFFFYKKITCASNNSNFYIMSSVYAFILRFKMLYIKQSYRTNVSFAANAIGNVAMSDAPRQRSNRQIGVSGAAPSFVRT
jgi:hypothetical protein